MSWSTGERLTLDRAVDEQAMRGADKVCTVMADEPITYSQMADRSTSVANGLLDLGVGHGDSVALLSQNCPEMLYTWFGAGKVGALEVAINSAYRGEFLRHQLDNCQAKVVVTEPELAQRVLAVAPSLPELRTVVVRGSDSSAALADLDAPPGIRLMTTEELLSSDSSRLRAHRAPSWDEPCSIIYTGGTTGPSKGAVLSHNYMVRAAQKFAASLRSGPDDVIYTPLPLFHLNAKAVTVLGSILTGQTGVIDRRFSVSRFWDRVREYNATGISILGSMIMMLWNLPRTEADARLPVRSMLAAPIPAELHRAIEERYRLTITVMYGLSEAAPLIFSSVDSPPVPGSSGTVNRSYDVRLFDDNESEVAVGEVGEVVCRPLEPHVMFDGYHRNEKATLAAFRNLWFHTGDLGRFDRDGNFFFVDRKKDAMRRRGENISSYEVERAVLLHPDVAEVAAHAVPSEFSEDDVKICVILRPGASPSHEAIMDHCVASMPAFATPRYIEFVEDLPRSPVGRILKYELRERGRTPGTWDREEVGYVVAR
jgi:crotonobetaine/carnitine-CoA ligase